MSSADSGRPAEAGKPTMQTRTLVKKPSKRRLPQAFRLTDRAAAAAPAPAEPALDDAARRRMHVDDLSSDDEAPRNTIGNVPLQWYADYSHIGYDVSGQRIVRKDRGDRIDKFLASQDDPLHKWTIYDAENDEEIVLSKRDVQILRNLQAGTYAHPEFDPTAPQYNLTDLYSSEVEIHPLNSGPEPKRRFLPSKWEMRKVMRIAKAIKEGRAQQQTAKPAGPRPLYLLWGADTGAVPGWDADKRLRGPLPIPAPKLPPPGHGASYNPPPEYLPTPAEAAAWAAADPGDRASDTLPTRYACLRHVPLYKPGIRERFERCLDLYLCPRAMRDKLQVDPASLLPALPDPAELRPFPTAIAVRYSGHSARVRSISVDPSGTWLLSAGDDRRVLLWEVATGRCLRGWATADTPHQVAWCPAPALALAAVVEGCRLHLLYAGTATAGNAAATFDALRGYRRGERRGNDASAVPAAADGDTDDDDQDGDSVAEAEGHSGGGAARIPSRRGPGKGGRKAVAAVDDEGEVGSAGDADDGDNDDASAADAADSCAAGGGEAGEGGEGEGLGAAAGAAAARRASGTMSGVAFRAAAWAQSALFPATAYALLPQPHAAAARIGASVAASASNCGAAATGFVVSVTLSNQAKRLAWHAGGDYCVTVAPGAPAGAVMIHRISRRSSTSPLTKNYGQPQCAAFHPAKPWLYVASQHTVRVYDLQAATLVSKLESGVKWISSLDVHPGGDHLVLGSYDARTVWFDTELSSRPFKTLRYHTKGVRRVAFHRGGAPLLATASDDGSLHVFHARVFPDELGANPLIVPVKILRGHAVSTEGLGVLDACWHPTQPWLFSAGADHSVLLWHNLP